MEFILLAVIFVTFVWIFRKTFKQWAETAERMSSVTADEVFVTTEQRSAKLDDIITDDLMIKSASAKSKVAMLKAGTAPSSE